jgi:hypothetical protein
VTSVRSVADGARYARRLVNATLHRFGPPASGLRVLDISLPDPLPPPRPDLRPGQDLLIIVGRGAELHGPDVFGAHFSLSVPLPDAVLATVGQVQDGVIEMTYQPVPPCPDHQHPLQPALDDGVPSWVCPVDAGHHAEPIGP